MNMKNIHQRNVVIAVGSLLLIVAIVASMCIPTTCMVKKAYTEEYQVPVYKTVTHNDPIYADKYKTVTHSEPKYKTLYTYYLEGGYVIDNVYDIDTTYTGTDFWGNPEYTVVVYYYDGLSKKSKTYYEKDSFRKKDTYEAIVGYNTWTEQVLDGQEIVGYDTWTEKIVAKYDTKERTAYRDVKYNCSLFSKITGTCG